jgi:secondary thiamine-phosphate synthase enzyme
MTTLTIETSKRNEMIDISSKVGSAVAESGIESGIAVVFVPHTTAAVTINENADPSVVRDITATLSELVPANAGYTHAEGNADSHIKAVAVGSSVTIIIDGGRPVLGTWQGVFFCEYDGPRRRKVHVQCVGT